MSLAGSSLDAQDNQANWPRFGGPSTATSHGMRLRRAFPQERLLPPATCRTRSLVAAVRGAYSAGAQTLARELLDRLADRMLVLAHRISACWELWRDAGHLRGAAVADRRFLLPARC